MIDGYASSHDLFHLPAVLGPVDGCEECQWEMRDPDEEQDGV